MPTFMDVHGDLKLPHEPVEQITQDTRDHALDQFGVRQGDVFHNPDGKVYGLLAAPDADAVRRHPAALGVPCGEVQR